MLKLNYPFFWQYKGMMSYLLWPLSQIYRTLSNIRQLIIKPIHFKAKVICVGNITVGGTGKTQIVIWLAKFLQDRKVKFVIVTKGYRGILREPTIINPTHTTSDVGDESILLSKYGQVISAKKIWQTASIINNLNPQVIIIDDGMQNPNFYKDFNILAVDGFRDFGNEFLIPAGPLREHISTGLKKSDMVIIVGKSKTNQLIDKLYDYKKPIFKAITAPCKNELDTELNYLAFCGIGNPEKFFHTLTVSQFRLVKTKVFPDHHCYNLNEIKDLIIEGQKLNAVLITTTKDYVKIPKEFLNSNIKFLDTELVIDNENALKSFINEKVIN